jgi:hypothetical protein
MGPCAVIGNLCPAQTSQEPVAPFLVPPSRPMIGDAAWKKAR